MSEGRTTKLWVQTSLMVIIYLLIAQLPLKHPTRAKVTWGDIYFFIMTGHLVDVQHKEVKEFAGNSLADN